MFKHILANAGDINWMAIFALLTFFLMFIVTIVAMYGKSKSFADHMANLPLDESDSHTTEKELHHEK